MKVPDCNILELIDLFSLLLTAVMVIPIFVFSLVQYQADFFQAVTLHPWNKMEMESNEVYVCISVFCM